MPPAEFEIDDAKAFDENLAAFVDHLHSIDPVLAPALALKLRALLSGATSKAELWDALSAVLTAEGGSP